MTQPGSLTWFSRHETRLFWRDFLSMLTAGNRRREGLVIIVGLLFVVGVHFLANAVLGSGARNGFRPDPTTLLIISGSIGMAMSMILSQAMESVTRAFYARSDLDLILSSPIRARRLFCVRMGAVAISSTILTLVLAGPFINVLIYWDGPKWLAAYGVILLLGTVSSAFAIASAVGMFRLLGPRRTRFISQIVSAVVGAAFVIGIQAAAILSAGTVSRIRFLRSDQIAAWAPDPFSPLWWPARAAMGDSLWLAPVLIGSLGLLAIIIAAASANFATYVIAAAGVDFGPSRVKAVDAPFRQRSVRQVLRHKEWTLLRRDPWLMSQSLMQILYLIPPALLLWRYYGDQAGVLLVLVPVLVMAAGQLSGGLAWLAVSGEDAPELIASAPISRRLVIWAKIEAVLTAVLFLAAPILIALLIAVPRFGVAALAGVVVAAVSGTAIQIWFRSQARRTHFRRRHTSSRIATLAEALVSILWAGAAAIAAAQSWLALMPAISAVLVLTCVWAIRPRRADGI